MFWKAGQFDRLLLISKLWSAECFPRLHLLGLEDGRNMSSVQILQSRQRNMNKNVYTKKIPTPHPTLPSSKTLFQNKNHTPGPFPSDTSGLLSYTFKSAVKEIDTSSSLFFMTSQSRHQCKVPQPVTSRYVPFSAGPPRARSPCHIVA